MPDVPIAPSLLNDETWRLDAARRAVALFPNSGVHDVAAIMASAHPYAIQYLEQAPALIPLVTMGASARTAADRTIVARRFGEAVYKAPRLREVLRRFHAPLPLRKLRGRAVIPSNYQTIIELCKVPPSQLSQAIPERSAHQTKWLRALRVFFSRHTHRYGFRDTSREWLWAVTAFSDAIQCEVPRVVERVSDVTDMLCHAPARFNPEWSFQSALANAAQWHEELAKRQNEERFLKSHGIEFDHQIDYAPLSNETTVDGLAFVALRSGLDLFMDGKEMHHCVSSYSGDVILGPTRIYSIQRDGFRVATMELQPLGGKTYQMVQLKGPYNHEPPAAVKDVARRFVEQQNQNINRAMGKKR